MLIVISENGIKQCLYAAAVPIKLSGINRKSDNRVDIAVLLALVPYADGNASLRYRMEDVFRKHNIEVTALLIVRVENSELVVVGNSVLSDVNHTVCGIPVVYCKLKRTDEMLARRSGSALEIESGNIGGKLDSVAVHT